MKYVVLTNAFFSVTGLQCAIGAKPNNNTLNHIQHDIYMDMLLHSRIELCSLQDRRTSATPLPPTFFNQSSPGLRQSIYVQPSSDPFGISYCNSMMLGTCCISWDFHSYPHLFPRTLNIFAGVVKTLAVFASLFVGAPAYYIFFATVEMITTVFIVYSAWTWKG